MGRLRAYVRRLRSVVMPASARNTVSAISAHCGSVGTGTTTIVGSLAVSFVTIVSPPPATATVFVAVKLPQHGFTVNVRGNADAPGVTTAALLQSTMAVTPGQMRHENLTLQDQPVPVADTTESPLGKSS